MKKFILMMLAAVLMCSCSCENKQNKLAEEAVVADSAQAVVALDVENVTGTNRQYMFTTYGENYRWYECCVLLKDFMDTEECDGTVAGVSNVFFVVTEFEDGSFDPKAVLISQAGDKSVTDVREGIWVGDSPMNDDAIKVTFAQAYQRLMEANCNKPHSRHCVLRQEVGPVAANPQYIFGNQKMQVYVDAVTGEVSLENPAFKGFTLNKPLGEWP